MNWIEEESRVIWRPFTQEKTAPKAIPVVSGHGATLVGADGRPFLDMISSWWVNMHGHSHPAIAAAVAEQAKTLEHVIFATCTHEPAVKLACAVAEALPGRLERVFYSDNGSSAVEVGLKMALQYFRNKGDTARKRFVAMDGAYHGDTVGAMSAGVSSGFFEAWTELMFPVDTLPGASTWIGDTALEEKEATALAALDTYLAAHGDALIAAIVEPLVQGAGGMRMHRPEFLRAWVGKLRAAGALIIFDEVMTGFGRLGPPFASVKAEVEPDIICLSKGISGGFMALAATVTHPGIYEAFLDDSPDKAFLHGHSYTANPIACAAGCASIELLLGQACTKRRAEIEAFHRRALPALAEAPGVSQPRITGTIAALTLAPIEGRDPNLELKRFFAEVPILIRPMGDTLYLMPPYCITDEELTQAYAAMARGLQQVYGA